MWDWGLVSQKEPRHLVWLIDILMTISWWLIVPCRRDHCISSVIYHPRVCHLPFKGLSPPVICPSRVFHLLFSIKGSLILSFTPQGSLISCYLLFKRSPISCHLPFKGLSSVICRSRVSAISCCLFVTSHQVVPQTQTVHKIKIFTCFCLCRDHLCLFHVHVFWAQRPVGFWHDHINTNWGCLQSRMVCIMKYWYIYL